MNHQPFLDQPLQHFEMCSTSLDKSLLNTTASSSHGEYISPPINLQPPQYENNNSPLNHSMDLSQGPMEPEPEYTDTYCCCLKRLVVNCFMGLIVESFNSGILSDETQS